MIETQFLKRRFGLSLDARKSVADLVIRKQMSTMTMLHDMC